MNLYDSQSQRSIVKRGSQKQPLDCNQRIVKRKNSIWKDPHAHAKNFVTISTIEKETRKNIFENQSIVETVQHIMQLPSIARTNDQKNLIVAVIKKMNFFCRFLQSKNLNKIEKYITYQQQNKGDVIYEKDDSADELFVIISGVVKRISDEYEEIEKVDNEDKNDVNSKESENRYFFIHSFYI